MALGQSGGEVAGQTDVLINAARQARGAGNYRQATTLLVQAMTWHRGQGHDHSIGGMTLTPAWHAFGQLLRELGLVTREQGNFQRARALFEESLAFHRAVDDRACLALALIGLADVARDQGDAEQVRAHGETALAIGFTLNTLALGSYYAGDLVRARTFIRESEALFRSLDAGGSLAEILITAGKIEHALGDTVAAYDALSEALRRAQATGPRVFVAASLEGLAIVAAMRGQAHQAAQCLAVASALRLHMGAPVWPADQSTVDTALAASRAILGDDVLQRCGRRYTLSRLNNSSAEFPVRNQATFSGRVKRTISHIPAARPIALAGACSPTSARVQERIVPIVRKISMTRKGRSFWPLSRRAKAFYPFCADFAFT
jgi:tetratricopeptide (TPR) repeat protein